MMKVLYIGMLLLAASSKICQAFQTHMAGGLKQRRLQPLYIVHIATPNNYPTSLQVDEIKDVQVNDIKEQIKAAASSLHKVKPATNAFYGALELTTVFGTVVGAHAVGPLTALLVTLKASESAINSLGKASSLSEEVARFQRSLEAVKESVESTLGECGVDGCDLESIPPQVMELNQLIHEGQEYIRGLANTKCYVTNLTRQFLQGEDCPASKLNRLTAQIQQAEARMQLYKTIQLAEKEHRYEVDLLKKQMERLQLAMADLSFKYKFETDGELLP
jgi:DNA repair ATPase RecN